MVLQKKLRVLSFYKQSLALMVEFRVVEPMHPSSNLRLSMDVCIGVECVCVYS
jgi:hypothetical protein